MSKQIRGRITFSNVVALLALFFALGGSVYAAQKFSGKEVKKNSLPGNRVKKNSLTGKQIKDSSLKGVGSATALSRVTYQTATGTLDPAASTALTVTATCPSPQKAIGGGAAVGNSLNSFVNDATFTADHSGYVAHGFTSGPGTDTLTVTAACVPVSATTP
jgi:hypothetical protein